MSNHNVEEIGSMSMKDRSANSSIHVRDLPERWNDLECGARTTPLERPLLKEGQIVASRQLEAAREVRFDPALNVIEAVGEHAPFGVDALIDGTTWLAAKRSMTMNSMLACS